MSDTFQVTPTPLETIPGIVADLNSTFHSGLNLPIERRKEQLRQLWKLIDVRIWHSKICPNTRLTLNRKTNMSCEKR